jgi:hypothetical protein
MYACINTRAGPKEARIEIRLKLHTSYIHTYMHPHTRSGCGIPIGERISLSEVVYSYVVNAFFSEPARRNAQRPVTERMIPVQVEHEDDG